MRTITAKNGKTYVIDHHGDFRTGYRATRDGKPFGPIRFAFPDAKPGTVAREIRDAAEQDAAYDRFMYRA